MFAANWHKVGNPEIQYSPFPPCQLIANELTKLPASQVNKHVNFLMETTITVCTVCIPNNTISVYSLYTKQHNKCVQFVHQYKQTT